MTHAVYTPFLRRFTDERARDLKETAALYNQVQSAHQASVWGRADAIERVSSHIVDCIVEAVELPPSTKIGKPLDRCLKEVLALETTIFSSPTIDWGLAHLTMKEQVDLCRFLRAQQYFLAH